MTNERDFLENLKNETLEQVPLNFTREVIKKSGMLNNERKVKVISRSELFYSGACALTGIMIIGLVAFNYKGVNVMPNKVGINAVILTQQLAESLKEVIINKNL